MRDSGCSFVCADCTLKNPVKLLGVSTSAATSSPLLDASASVSSSPPTAATSPSVTKKKDVGKEKDEDEEIAPGPSTLSLADWTAVVRRSIDKERRRREIFIVGLNLINSERCPERSDGRGVRSEADEQLDRLLKHYLGALAKIDIGAYSWVRIGKADDKGRQTVKVTFTSDVIVDQLLAFAPCLRYKFSSFAPVQRKKVMEYFPEGPPGFRNVFLRRSLSKEEADFAYQQRVAKRSRK